MSTGNSTGNVNIVADNTNIPMLSTTSDDPDLPKKMALEPSLSATTADDPMVPVGTEKADAKTEQEATPEPTEQVEEKPAKKDETPPWMKAFVTKERRAREAAEAETAETKRMLAQVLERMQTGNPAPKAEGPVEPDENDYADTASYKAAMRQHTKDVAAHAARAAIDVYDGQQRDAAMKARAAKEEEARQEFLDRGRAKYADFAEKCETEDLPITDAMFLAAKRIKNGEDVVYHLADHPAEAKRIAKMDPADQLLEMKEIEFRLRVPAAPATSATTVQTAPAKPRTPAPIKPVGASNVVRKEPEKMTMDEYAKWVRAGRPD